MLFDFQAFKDKFTDLFYEYIGSSFFPHRFHAKQNMCF